MSDIKENICQRCCEKQYEINWLIMELNKTRKALHRRDRFIDLPDYHLGDFIRDDVKSLAHFYKNK